MNRRGGITPPSTGRDARFCARFYWVLRGRKCLPRYREPFSPKAHPVTPKFALAFAPPAGVLVLANPLEWTFTDQTALTVVGGVATTTTKRASQVIGRLAQLHSAARVAAAMAELAIGAGIDAEHCRAPLMIAATGWRRS